MSGLTFGPFEGLHIAGGAIALPPNQLTTTDALKYVPKERSMSDERRLYIATQIDTQVGTQHRHWSYTPGDPIAKGPDSASLASEALQGALHAAGIQAAQLDLLLTATSTPHRYTGTVSSEVGQQLGIHAPCVDVRAGCSSGIFALTQAAFHLQAGAQYVAIVGTDTFSAVIPPAHRLGLCTMGDGAAALVLKRGEAILKSIYFESDGALSGLIATPGPMPPSKEACEAGLYQLAGDPQGFEQHIKTYYLQAIERVLDHSQLQGHQIDWFIPHQTSTSLAKSIAEHFAIPQERVWTKGISRHANIGAAGWIAGLSGALHEGDIKPGQHVLSACVGGGMSWGAAVWRC
ncbi:MAG: hypothetical protein CL920_35245 [Deltaproteobacteria bacterium]|nr:hypothetical protein [Deltaproteobacteria bacterium]MBU53980.1 hypothetical protein [Deltaproteobacteria bacterium]|tara:strand:+ start:764 stop:1804 length:1041 start_codon:yes stop_codon:yes gene_type:complete